MLVYTFWPGLKSKDYKTYPNLSNANLIKATSKFHLIDKKFEFLLSLHYLICFIQSKLPNIPNNNNLMKTTNKVLIILKNHDQLFFLVLDIFSVL